MDTLVAKLRGVRVLVVGDIMLDETWLGDATRLSPEAPVPVVNVQSATYVLGGAANTAVNACSLGGVVHLVGAVGKDQAAHTCDGLAAALALSATWIVDATRPTTLKTRIVARGHQVVRADREAKHPLEGAAFQQLLSTVQAALAESDVLILSDYAKGVLHPTCIRRLIDLAQLHRVPVVVDPKHSDFSVYSGATVLTPNAPELAAAVGHEVAHGVVNSTEVEALLEHANVSAILATRGAEGMSLLRRGQAAVHIATAAKQVFDVTGAGDTVVATLALCVGAGLSLEQGMRLATLAAGEVVSKRGTASITCDELSAAARETAMA